MSELQNGSEFRRLHPGTWAGGLKIRFWVPVTKVLLFYYTAISKLSISGSWGSLGCFGHPDGPLNLVLAACRQSGTFLLHCY